MDTIYSYVESVFVNLPRTSEMKQLKEDMLHSMEEKYQDLKQKGVSENEAIGTVLAEFGNIDEIVEEYNLSLEEEKAVAQADTFFLDEQETEDYLLHRHKFAFGISLGVFLCILSVSLFFAVQTFFQYLFPTASETIHGTLSTAILLLTIAAGVALFIIFGMRESNYPFGQKILRLDAATYSRLKLEYNSFKPRFGYAIAMGVVFCMLGPISLLLSIIFLGEDNPLSIVFLMGFIAAGVFLFVYFGIQNDTYEKLLSVGSYTPAKVKASKISDTIASIVFPLATIYYLYQGFIHENWATAWIVFPIVGIGFGIFAAITEAITGMRERQ